MNCRRSRRRGAVQQDISVEVGGEERPEQVRYEEPGGSAVPAARGEDVESHEDIQQYDVDESGQRIAQREEQDAPQEVGDKLQDPQPDDSFVLPTHDETPERKSHAEVQDAPGDRKYDIGRRECRLGQRRIPFGDGRSLEKTCRDTYCKAGEDGNEVSRYFFHAWGIEVFLIPCKNSANYAVFFPNLIKIIGFESNSGSFIDVFFAGADVVFPVFVVNVSINGFGDIRYDSGICFRVFRRIFDEDGDGIAGAVRQDDESRIVGPGEDASFVAVARAGFVSDDGAGSRQWFRKTVGTCFSLSGFAGSFPAV